MTDYTIISRFRNKVQCEYLVKKLEERGKSCYNFCAQPADPANPDAHPEEQMKVFEGVENFFQDELYKKFFSRTWMD